MNDHVCNARGLVLHVGHSNDIKELKKFFGGIKYICDWFLRMVRRLIDDVLALDKFMRHQLTIVLLEVSENVSHSVVDGFCRVIVYIREISLLDYAKNLLHEGLLDSRHFEKYMHFLGVRD